MDEIEGPASERGAVPCGVLPAVVVPRGPAPHIGVVLEGGGGLLVPREVVASLLLN